MSLEFLLTSLIVVIAPGAGVLYTLAAGLARGGRASVAAAFGCTLGIVPHMAAAILGLAALLHASALAFGIVKYVGVCWLLWLAWSTLRQRGALDVGEAPDARSALRIALTGTLVNVLNPKLSIFFLAFLPQFVDPSRGHAAMQMAFLGLLFTLLGLITDGCYALAAGTAGNWLKRSRGFLKWERYCTGTLLVGLGVTAALAGTQKK